MNVLTIAMGRDERDLIVHFVRHYRQLGDVVIYDDGSRDGMSEIARTEGAIVQPVDQDESELEYRLLKIKNHAWKPMRDQYDWVIVVDLDEFLYHKNLSQALLHARELGITILEPVGYRMVSTEQPHIDRLLPGAVRRGVPCKLTSKRCCFNPMKITEINYYVGAHSAFPEGDVSSQPYYGLKLLHYHFMGAAWVSARYARRRIWRGGPPLDPNWQDHGNTPEEVRWIIGDLDARATEVI